MGSVALVNATSRPSGLTSASPLTPSISKASPSPSLRRNHVEVTPLRRERKLKSFPSGLKRGREASKAGTVIRRRGAEPSVDASQISLRRTFSASLMVWRVKATKAPSGDIDGSSALSIR